MFKIGQKVYCIDATDPLGQRKNFQQWVQNSTQYTIRRCEGSLQGKVRVLLEEVRNKPLYIPEMMGKVEPGFGAHRFVTKEQFLMGEVNVKEEVIEV